jgi:hypothetical protein
MKGYLRRVVPSTKGVKEATQGSQAAASRLAHYTRRGMTNAVPGAEMGVRREAARTVKEARKLRAKSLAAGAGYGAAAGAGGVLVSRKNVEKALFRAKPKAVLERVPFSPRDLWAEVPAPKKLSASKKMRRQKRDFLEKRPFEPTDPWRVGKAFKLPTLPRGRLMPKSRFMRKPSVRSSYIGTSVSGKKFSVRGSVR